MTQTMHVMEKDFCGEKSIDPRTPLAWQTRIVQCLMNSAKGDLMLDQYGNLTTRNIWSEDYRELPFAQHTPGNVLALIGPKGWYLTLFGADFLLENCPPESKRDVRLLEYVCGRR